jgi:hypothetical protein
MNRLGRRHFLKLELKNRLGSRLGGTRLVCNGRRLGDNTFMSTGLKLF